MIYGCSHSRALSNFCLVLAVLSLAPSATGQCTTATLMKNSGASQDHFGSAVAIDGDFMVVGADLYDSGAVDTGAAFVYRRINDVWTYLGQLVPGNLLKAGDQFGVNVAIDGGRIIVGAPFSDIAATNAGAAFIFDWIASGQYWNFAATLVAGSPEVDQRFGTGVDVDGDRVVVGAFMDDVAPGSGIDIGAAWLYKRNANGTWGSGQVLWPNFNQFEFDHFGYSVAISGNLIAVGADLNDSAGTEAGLVQIYRSTFGSFQPAESLTAPEFAVAGDQFGVSVALDGTTLVVGSHLDDEKGTNAGAIYIYEDWPQYPSSGMEFVAKLTATNPQVGAQLGWRVAVDGDLIAASVYGHDSAGAPDGGAVQVFRRVGDVWKSEPMVIPPAVASGDFAGFGVSVSDPRVAIGSPFHDSGMVDAGRVNIADYSACVGVYSVPTTISIWGGGTLKLFLNAGALNAQRSYVVLGSASGTSPGFNVGAAHLPLNPDALTLIMLNSLQTGGGGLAGVLDASGRASATLPIPACLSGAMSGIHVDYAALVYSANPVLPNFAYGPWRTEFRVPNLYAPMPQIDVQYYQGTNEIQYQVAPPVTFDGWHSDVAWQSVNNEIEQFHWDFGDGTTGSGPGVVHQYPTGGVYTCSLTVIDSYGACQTTTSTVEINKMALGKFTFPQSIVAGQSAKFDGSLSSDPDGVIVKYNWDFGDSLIQTTEPSVDHAFPAWMAGQTVTVRLTVVDDDGLASSNIATHDVYIQ